MGAALGAYALGLDPQPAVHHTTLHFERPGVGLGAQLIGLGRVAPQHQAALPADGDGHVAI
jgi:hypothetical protein